MAKAMAHEVDASEDKQLETAVKDYIDKMQQANLRMDKRQIEIERLKAETRIMLSRIRELKAS